MTGHYKRQDDDDFSVLAWWPAFCLAYDVAAAACLAWLLSRASGPTVATR